MKTIFVIRNLAIVTILLLTKINGFAQEPLTEYYPIGTTWEEVFMRFNRYPGEVIEEPVVFVRYQYTVDRDTIIDNKTYKVLVSTILDYVQIPQGLFEETEYYFREEGDCIYFNYYGEGYDELIYNFNWQDDMSVLLSNGNKYDIQNLTFSQEVLLDGNTYDCYNKNYSIMKKVYKSVGQTVGGLMVGIVDGARYGNRHHLTKFTRNNVLIYENDYPTPQVVGIYEIKSDKEMFQQDCYTLQGEKVDITKLKPGVYIKNGRKIVIK